MTTIPVVCSCGQQLHARPEAAGTLAKCPACGELVEVPGGRRSSWGHGELVALRAGLYAVLGLSALVFVLGAELAKATSAGCLTVALVGLAVCNLAARRERER